MDSLLFPLPALDLALGLIPPPLSHYSTLNGELIALNATRDTKTPLWRIKLAGAIRSSPAYADDKVIIGDDAGHLYALNATTGPPTRGHHLCLC